jgi:hypothetical protein
MKYYADYVDSDVLPGEVYSARFGEDILFNPQSKVDYMTGKKFKFKPKESGDLFQRFLALQADPEALFTETARMPNTPFGNLSQYMGG